MNIFTPEKLVSAQQDNIAALIAISNLAFQGFRSLMQSNMQALKPVIESGEAIWKRALAGNGHEAFPAGEFNAAQAMLGNVVPFNPRIYEITSSTQADCLKIAQAQYDKYHRNVLRAVDSFAKNASPGSEAAVTALTTAFLNTNAACDVTRNAARVIETTRSSFAAATTVASNLPASIYKETARSVKPAL